VTAEVVNEVNRESDQGILRPRSGFMNEEEPHFASSEESADDVELDFRDRYRMRCKPAWLRAIVMCIFFAVCQGIIVLFLVDQEPTDSSKRTGAYCLDLRKPLS
jgi:hypothetical protein